MSDVAIRVEGLGKRYRRGVPAGNDRLSEVVVNLSRFAWSLPRRLAGRARRLPEAPSPPLRSDEFWALKDVSFEVKQGEVVGVIGRNGAGKSTLLKVLSRITEPTEGRVGLRGRVASLLEVGTGFHGELTGRENVYLSGALLGMSRAEIAARFDEIVAFAEVDGFLDTPVKRYSSGMLMRLAFAVAAHLESEILIVDEVLAVGDATFQKKCLGKMGEVARGGRTVLFVTHAAAVAQSMCTGGVALERGRVKVAGTIRAAFDALREAPEETFRAGGNENIWVRSVRVAPATGDTIDVHSGVRITIEFECKVRARLVDCTVELRNADGVVVFHQGTFLNDGGYCTAGVYRVTVTTPPDLLNSGEYRAHVIFGQSRSILLYLLDPACSFEVANVPSHGSLLAVPGVVRTELGWQAERVGDLN